MSEIKFCKETCAKENLIGFSMFHTNYHLYINPILVNNSKRCNIFCIPYCTGNKMLLKEYIYNFGNQKIFINFTCDHYLNTDHGDFVIGEEIKNLKRRNVLKHILDLYYKSRIYHLPDITDCCYEFERLVTS